MVRSELPAGPLYRGRVAVTLRPMGVDEFARWLPKVRDFYAQDMVTNGGASEDEAQRKAIADTEQLFPGDQPCADQFATTGRWSEVPSRVLRSNLRGAV